ncbi:MAG TPA: RNA 2',3'-cyclic phosphodiesterase [Planctomycetota bacterium]|nr:RNA 2',3'-cyclic phosphodiesterase [Planctomycetota bacterium]
MECWRCFVSMPLPPDLQQRVGDLQQRLVSRLSSNAIKWTRREQIHLTLAFLGDVEVSKIEAAKADLAGCCGCGPMDLSLESVGCFPNFKRPSVIWIGVEGQVAALSALAASIRTKLASYCERPEKKPFNAHLTIARTKEAPFRELARIGASIQSMQMEPLGSWRADEVHLVRSELLREGARHTVLSTVKLNATPSAPS